MTDTANPAKRDRAEELADSLTVPYLRDPIISAIRQYGREVRAQDVEVCRDRADRCGHRAAPTSVGDACATSIKLKPLP